MTTPHDDEQPARAVGGWRAVARPAADAAAAARPAADPVSSTDPADDTHDAAIADFASETDEPGGVDAADAHERDGFGNGSLLAVGVFAGIYLLYTIGWFAAGTRLEFFGSILLGGETVFSIVRWAAVLVPALWFGAVMLLSMRSRAWVRVTGLLAGAVVLIPWPFVIQWQNALLGGAQ